MQEVFIEVSKAVFAICDSESMYIYNLMEYVHSRKGEEFEVQAFTGVESLCACAKEKTIEILLISGKLLCEQQLRIVCCKNDLCAIRICGLALELCDDIVHQHGVKLTLQLIHQ